MKINIEFSIKEKLYQKDEKKDLSREKIIAKASYKLALEYENEKKFRTLSKAQKRKDP